MGPEYIVLTLGQSLVSGYPLLEVGTTPPYNEQVIWAQRPELKAKDVTIYRVITK